jgi:mannonate dehydratase
MAIPNFGIQEYMGHIGPASDVFHYQYRYSAGMMHPGDEPGLGVEIDEEAAERYPYQPKYLPVARLRDGSMHDW